MAYAFQVLKLQRDVQHRQCSRWRSEGNMATFVKWCSCMVYCMDESGAYPIAGFRPSPLFKPPQGTDARRNIVTVPSTTPVACMFVLCKFVCWKAPQIHQRSRSTALVTQLQSQCWLLLTRVNMLLKMSSVSAVSRGQCEPESMLRLSATYICANDCASH